MRVQVYSKSSQISTRSLGKLPTKNAMQLAQTSRSGSGRLLYASVVLATSLTDRSIITSEKRGLTTKGSAQQMLGSNKLVCSTFIFCSWPSSSKGQTYEKKSKKNTRDANDEHGRYINLISSLGPEISQEK